jgi:hypothetical protein
MFAAQDKKCGTTNAAQVNESSTVKAERRM